MEEGQPITHIERALCEGCPHPPHYGECPARVIDLTHAPVDRPCWCRVRATDEEPAPAVPTPTAR